ncbi:MAG: outer membrane protein assembly factor BamC [Halieaceae bacterium]|jgi:outer membrane protein assembly factor BamC
MTINSQKKILILSLVLSLSGCGYLFGDKGYFRNRSDDYLQSREVAVLEVPAGLDDSAIETVYVIPPVEEDVIISQEFEVPRPEALVAGEYDQMVRIQKLGDERWMVAAVTPGEVWPQMRSFLNAKGVGVGRIDGRQGIIETNWISLEDTGLRERYRITIDEGIQRDTSEVHVLQVTESPQTMQDWPAVSSDLEHEQQLLVELSQYMANSAETSTVSMIAQTSISSSGKVTLQKSDAGKPFIRLRLPFYRAWAALGPALKKSSFEIEDLDRSSGKYFVLFVEPTEQDEDGWFSWMFGGDSDAINLAGNKYEVLVISADDFESVTITIYSPDGSELVRGEAEKLLSVIKSNLS